MSDDVFTDPNNKVEVEPPELGPVFTKVLTSALSKRFAAEFKKPWTAANETKMQEEISVLVAEAKKRALATIKVIIVKPNGQRTVRDLLVEKISRERKLQ